MRNLEPYKLILHPNCTVDKQLHYKYQSHFYILSSSNAVVCGTEYLVSETEDRENIKYWICVTWLSSVQCLFVPAVISAVPDI
jgi:hypothetical protein